MTTNNNNTPDEDDLDYLFEVLKHDQIHFDKDRIEDKEFHIGCRSTYLVKPNNFDFLHDIAHLIQLSDAELKTHYIEYGGRLKFNLPQQFIYNRYVCEPITDKISMRELETFYIQYILDNNILNKNLSFETWIDNYDVIGLLDWLPDNYVFGYKPSLEYVLERASEFITKWNYENAIARWKSINVKIGE
jgi:hypothetical protein